MKCKLIFSRFSFLNVQLFSKFEQRRNELSKAKRNSALLDLFVFYCVPWILSKAKHDFSKEKGYRVRPFALLPCSGLPGFPSR